MNRIFTWIIFTISILLLIVFVILLMIIGAITYIPYKIYISCAGTLAGSAHLVTNIGEDAKMRERNR